MLGSRLTYVQCLLIALASCIHRKEFDVLKLVWSRGFGVGGGRGSLCEQVTSERKCKAVCLLGVCYGMYMHENKFAENVFCYP